ncbi:MAG: GAF domain-containing protein [Thermoplasmata archaeon]|nr:GAF domain-containing protein [Thermoplasmata archaeon]
MTTTPNPRLEEIRIRIERTLSASSQNDLKAIYDALKANSDKTVKNWASAIAKSSYLRATEFKEPQDVRLDRMKVFYDALVEKAENPESRRADELLRGFIRGEHARAADVASLVRKESLLRDVMFTGVEKELADVAKPRVKMAVDSVVDRAIELTVWMEQAYYEMHTSLAKSLPGSPDGETSLDQAITRFCKDLMDYFGIEFVTLFRYDSNKGELVCQASSARGVALTRDTTVLLDSFPVAREIVSTGKAVVSSSTKEPRKIVIGRMAFQHAMAFPLLRQGAVNGVFFMGDNSRTVELTPDEASVAEDMVAHLSWALQNAELLQQMDVRARGQRALIETAASLQQEIESDEIYRIVATKLSEIIPCNEFAFYVFDWERNLCNPVYATGPYTGEIMADRDFPADTGVVGYVGKTRRAEIVVDTEKDPRGAYIPGTPTTNTRMLAIPVIGQKEVLGVIELQKYPPEVFTQDDLEIGVLFANHASVALENARLLKELRTARDQIELHMDLLTHDIANYTTPILAYFEALNSKKDKDPEVHALVNRTLRQVESMTRLVEMVRTMSRLREKTTKKYRKIDLRKALEATAKDVRTRSLKDEIQVELELPDEPLMVMADEMLKDLFLHLVYGAALLEKQQKTVLKVTVEARRDNKMEYWWVKVAQPNRAIPHNLKGAVLRVAKTSKSELAGGFGIGLAAAKGIVDRYAGNMWVSDIVQGDYTKGCVFNVMLPRVR